MTTTRRERKRAQLRSEIIQAATGAFADGGYEQVSMRKLAADLGCAPGTLYLYFADKDELLLAVVKESFAGLLETFRSITAEGDPLISLKELLRAYVKFGLRSPQHYKCAFVLQAKGSRKRADEPRAAFQELRDRVRSCAHAGAVGMAEIEVTSQILWACVHGITSLLISRPAFPWINRKKLIDELIETAVAGVTRKKGNAGHGKHPSHQRANRETV